MAKSYEAHKAILDHQVEHVEHVVSSPKHVASNDISISEKDTKESDDSDDSGVTINIKGPVYFVEDVSQESLAELIRQALPSPQ